LHPGAIAIRLLASGMKGDYHKMDPAGESNSLSHITCDGDARMVDVSTKPVTKREARASARLACAPAVLDMIMDRKLPKGDALATARIAGIMAAKRTGDLIPLCHPLSLDCVSVRFQRLGPGELLIECSAVTSGRTGVEMEAMTGVSVAALTLYDMTKAADKAIVLGPIQLEYKGGGKSGEFRRS
jgi:cyclic pyranopterin phosphate synthase